MLISSNVNTIIDHRSMQGLFEAADNITPSRRDRDAINDPRYLLLLKSFTSIYVMESLL